MRLYTASETFRRKTERALKSTSPLVPFVDRKLKSVLPFWPTLHQLALEAFLQKHERTF
jgi:hypothetical protein